MSEEIQKDSEEKKKSSTPGSETLRILEAMIFASTEALSINKLKSIIPELQDARIVRSSINKINEILQRERHPFEIIEIAGGFQYRTVSYYQPWVQQLFKEKSSRRLSIQALECLAIIAYKQPISKAEIEAIRGVTSDGAMKTLLEKRLVTITGRSDKPGRPLLYGTTPTFLSYFGLSKITDLPKIEEFEAMAREKMEDLSEDELKHIESLPEGENDTDTVEKSEPEGTEESQTGQSSDVDTNTADASSASDGADEPAEGQTPETEENPAETPPSTDEDTDMNQGDTEGIHT